MLKQIRNTNIGLWQSILFGCVVAFVFGMIWNSPFKKNQVELDPFSHYRSEQSIWFADDLNGDGSTERIRCFHGVNSTSMDLIHYDLKGNITGHYKLGNDEWPVQLMPKIIDLDHDHKKELIFFTLRNDSIFLHLFSLTKFEFIGDPVFFSDVELPKEILACNSSFTDLMDLNNDGNDELFFKFDAGYGIYPRGIFRLDFPAMTIRKSATGYMNLSPSFFKDIDADGTPEVFVSCNAPNNTSDIEISTFSDTLSYLCIFDYDLNFLVEPIPFEGIYSSLQPLPDPNSSDFFYLAYNCRTKSEEPMRLMTVSKKGDILKEMGWKNMPNPEMTKLLMQTINRQPYLIFPNIGRFKLNYDLSGIPAQLKHQNNSITNYVYTYDLNKNGTDELIFTNAKDEITIYNEKDRSEVRFDSPIKILGILSIYDEYEKGQFKNHILTSSNGFFIFRYVANKLYYLNYLIYLLVFAVSAFTIWMILVNQKRRMETKWETEKQLSELQFNSIKNQLNPHFMFNALNSVAYMIHEGKKEEAYDFLSLNSRMIQRVMNDAQEVKRPLYDELQFSKDYISIQQQRFKDRFETEVKIAPGVNFKMEVPKMCIHTYVENAIKHGFRNIKSQGLLLIEINPLENGVLLKISDNGIGRKATAEFHDSPGTGVAMMKEFYRLFEKYHGYKIDYSESDPESGTGTRVILSIRKGTLPS